MHSVLIKAHLIIYSYILYHWDLSHFVFFMKQLNTEGGVNYPTNSAPISCM